MSGMRPQDCLLCAMRVVANARTSTTDAQLNFGKEKSHGFQSSWSWKKKACLSATAQLECEEETGPLDSKASKENMSCLDDPSGFPEVSIKLEQEEEPRIQDCQGLEDSKALSGSRLVKIEESSSPQSTTLAESRGTSLEVPLANVLLCPEQDNFTELAPKTKMPQEKHRGRRRSEVPLESTLLARKALKGVFESSDSEENSDVSSRAGDNDKYVPATKSCSEPENRVSSEISPATSTDEEQPLSGAPAVCGKMVTLQTDLNLATLLSLRSKLDSNSELFACLELALEKLSLEPPCVTNDALLTIAADQHVMQWISGKGNCEIVIYYSQGKPHCQVYVATWEQYLSCLCSQPQVLSLGNLLCTRSRLRCWSSSNKDMSLACFDEAVKRFLVEPIAVKQDARMLVECAGRVVAFVSGQGSCEISVFLENDVPLYNAQVKRTHVFLMRLRAGIVELNSENLREVRDRLGEGVLKRCFDFASSRFIHEPKCIQTNAKMVVMSSSDEALQLIAGKGQNLIMVFSTEDGISYQVSTCGWWELLARIMHKLQSAWPPGGTGDGRTRIEE
ncbi:hypothetical protein lerEdw1_009220 [Lerista edwardsae]|nr:hypothetical protein lerEdw1_009220 [Lerista edwardsae]